MPKNVLYVLLLGVAMAACASEEGKTETGAARTAEPKIEATPPATEKAATFIIGNGRVGSIAAGMPVAELHRQVPEHYLLSDTLLQQEGQEYKAYLLRREDSSTGLLVEQQCEPDCRVWRISVYSPDYKTATGLGVGSSFSEVQQHYTIDYVSLSEAGLVAVAAQDGISFVLDAAGIPQERLASLQPASVPAKTPVKRIFVY